MRSIWKDQRGNVSIIFVLSSVLLIGAAGMAIDYSYWTIQHTRMQEAADAGALAGAVELGRGGNRAVANAQARAEMAARSNLAGSANGAALTRSADQALGIVTVSFSKPGVRFLSVVMRDRDPDITVSSTAKIVDREVACIYALNPTASKAINGNGNAVLEGTNCAIQVNSTASDALTNSGTISASHICVAGGYAGVGYTPTPQQHCPTTDDPFASLVIPAAGPCTSTGRSVNTDISISASDDVFCGGLHVSSGATVSFAPGIYHFVDGTFKISGGGSVIGDEVVFVLHGTATIDIAGQGRVVTTPPVSGVLEGYSLVQDRDAPLGGTNKITGEGRFEFPGIIYLSRSQLDIAGRAAGNTYTPSYAAIVADTIKISGQGELRTTADTSKFSKKAATKLTVVNATLIE